VRAGLAPWLAGQRFRARDTVASAASRCRHEAFAFGWSRSPNLDHHTQPEGARFGSFGRIAAALLRWNEISATCLWRAASRESSSIAPLTSERLAGFVGCGPGLESKGAAPRRWCRPHRSRVGDRRLTSCSTRPAPCGCFEFSRLGWDSWSQLPVTPPAPEKLAAPLRASRPA
jgi:hypothetical protein